MKQTLLSLLFLLGVSIGLAQAEEISYDFSSSIPNAWTSSVVPNSFEGRGAQFTASGTLTLKGLQDISKVVILCSCNNSTEGGNSIEVSVAGKSWGTEGLKKETDVQKTFTGTSASGDVVLSLTRSSKSIYIKTVTVTCGGEGQGGGGEEGEGGGEDTPSTDLDPNYTYAEPTVVSTPGAENNNIPYEFVKNNIKVSCTTGALTDTYFGCNAGSSITFTATKPIKGISIDGYVKKGFDATASAGNITFESDPDTEVEANPVVVVTDINATSVTINCVKQLRCYNVSIYFDANPEGGTGGGGEEEEGDYTFDWEPTEATVINDAMAELYYIDYSDYFGFPYTSLYLGSEKGELYLDVFARSAKGTALQPGTYSVSADGADGTIMASPGGNDEEDIPSMYITDFEYDEEYDETFYTSAYYLESGTLTVAQDPSGVKMTFQGRSHFGSTINVTYVGPAIDLNEDDPDGIQSIEKANLSSIIKQFSKGQIVLKKGSRTYDLQGRRI